MKNLVRGFFIIAAMLVIYSSAAAQGKYGVKGKIFPHNQADSLFGKVTQSVQISTDELKGVIAKAKDYVFLTIKNNSPVVTNEKRESLIGNRVAPTHDETMHYFSKSKLTELLQGTSSTSVSIELRGTTLTLSTMESTMDMMAACPPVCL
jgi:oligoribonuclease NrnB/cAMP/cGMP phosphodiesterase (DHH superfamily)